MESETQTNRAWVAPGDVVSLRLCRAIPYRLVRYLVSLVGRRDGVDDFVQETWSESWSGVGRTRAIPL